MAKVQGRTHREIPWSKIETAWNRGDSYEKMALRFEYVNKQDKKDPYKPMRAVVSRGLSEGKLQPREGMRAIGIGKKAPKAKVAKVAKKQMVAKGKVGRPAVVGKTILIQLDAGNKLIRIEGSKPKTLVPATKFVHASIGVLNQLGYAVTKQEASTLPAEIPQAPKAETETVQPDPQVEVTPETTQTETVQPQVEPNTTETAA